MNDLPYLPASDGLLARNSGPWARRKHHFLRNYCGITTKALYRKLRLVYLDVMAGPGLCKIKETGDEFPGSPLVALDNEFAQYLFIEDDPELADALKKRVANHPKAKRVQIFNESWIKVFKTNRLLFDDKTLLIAFVDPTGISQVPLSAMLELTKNPKVDLLMTIQHSLGITLNLPQYLRSKTGQTALDSFLGTGAWRHWRSTEPSQFTLTAIDFFSERIKHEGFIGTRHVSVPEDQPLYRFTLFSRHELAEKFWNEILKIDETGQRELNF